MANYALEGQVWSDQLVTWSFAAANYGGQPGQFSSIFSPSTFLAGEIAEAFARWDQVTDLDFVQVSDAANVDIRIGYGQFDGPRGILAEASWTYSGSYFIRTTIRFDQQESYTIVGDDAFLSGGGTFKVIALHEIGHVIGLGHYDGAPAIMNTYLATQLRDLTTSEILGVRALYGEEPSSNLSVASIAAASASKNEGNGGAPVKGNPTSGTTAFTFTVSLDQAANTSKTVAYSVTGTGANAAAASDFVGNVLPSGTVTFAAGETSKTVTVNVKGETTVEATETFLVTLSNPSSGLTLGTTTAIGTIINDDGASVASVASIAATSANKSEGNSGATGFTFTVSLSQAPTTSQTVSYSVSGTGANPAAASDFVGNALPSGTVTFAAGETSKTVTINVQGNTTIEATETFLVTLSNPSSGLALGTTTATGTIVNDDNVVASIAAASASKNEGNSGTTAFTFTVSLDQAANTSQTVAYSVAGTGASPAAASDFVGGVLPSGTVTFAAGETSKTVTVDVQGNTTVEASEAFLVTLSNPSSGLTLGNTTATGTIVNDDGGSVASIAAASANKNEGNSGTTAFTFTVSLDQAPTASQTVSYSVTGTGANPAAASDFVGVGLREFSSPGAIDNYRRRKLKTLGDLVELRASTDRYLDELMPDLAEIDRMVESSHAVNGSPSLDDVRVLPQLRSLAVVKGLRFPRRLQDYFQTMMDRVGHRPLPSI